MSINTEGSVFNLSDGAPNELTPRQQHDLKDGDKIVGGSDGSTSFERTSTEESLTGELRPADNQLSSKSSPFQFSNSTSPNRLPTPNSNTVSGSESTSTVTEEVVPKGFPSVGEMTEDPIQESTQYSLNSQQHSPRDKQANESNQDDDGSAKDSRSFDQYPLQTSTQKSFDMMYPSMNSDITQESSAFITNPDIDNSSDNKENLQAFTDTIDDIDDVESSEDERHDSMENSILSWRKSLADMKRVGIEKDSSIFSVRVPNSPQNNSIIFNPQKSSLDSSPLLKKHSKSHLGLPHTGSVVSTDYVDTQFMDDEKLPSQSNRLTCIDKPPETKIQSPHEPLINFNKHLTYENNLSHKHSSPSSGVNLPLTFPPLTSHKLDELPSNLFNISKVNALKTQNETNLPQKEAMEPVKSLNKKPNPLKESDRFNATVDSLDSTRFNETQAQLDRDIDIDDSSKETAKLERLRARTNDSPWKRLRAPSNLGLTDQLTPDQSKFPLNKTAILMTPSFNKPGEFSSNASNASTINELHKQITGYKIQIKFFKQFLQSLIDKTRQQDKEELDLTELTHFQDNFNGFSPTDNQNTLQSNQRNEEQINKLQNDYDNLSRHYDEIYKLNEDLYSNLEEFQYKLQDKDFQLLTLNKNFDTCIGIAHDIIQLLINDPVTDEVSRIALIRSLDDHSGIADLDMKLHVIRLELNKKFDNNEHLKLTISSADQKSIASPKANNNEQIIQDLMHLLSSLQEEFDAKNYEVSQLQEDIKKETAESNILRKNQRAIQEKFDHLCQLLDKDKSSRMNAYGDEVDKLREENIHLTKINKTMDAKFDEYERIIDQLEKEVNEFKEYSTRRESIENTSVKTDFHEDVYLLHKEFNALQNEFNSLTADHRKLQDDSSKTISALTNQLSAKQNESQNLRANVMVNDKLKEELDLSVEKQRILKAEKIRLAYKIESLTEEKSKLQNTVQSLTDKVTTLTVADTDNEKTSNEANDRFIKMVNILEYQFDALILFDVYEFQKLLKSFNKIADDSSLKEPKKKIENLSRKINKSSQSKQNGENTFWSSSEIGLIRDYHKSIFEYFARAVDIIVNDHVKLLLRENDAKSKSDTYIQKLHERIDQLNVINDNLSKQIDNYDSKDDTSEYGTLNNTMTSPRSKMRIEELSNRWKAEREARVYESKEAKRRLKELEDENARLREQVDRK